MVGLPSTATCGTPAALVSWHSRASRVSWRSERMPSCMRLPPVAISDTTGCRARRATLNARSMRSPVCWPTEPPRNRKSKAISTAGTPPTVACPHTTDSVCPDRSLARSSCSA